MKYKDPRPINRTEAETAFASGNTEATCDALVRVTFHDSDWRWVQERCLDFVHSPNAEVRGLAATCLGHLARIHGELDLARVNPVLLALAQDPEVGGRAEDALDDIRLHLGRG
jgi:hypothetical protein